MSKPRNLKELDEMAKNLENRLRKDPFSADEKKRIKEEDEKHHLDEIHNRLAHYKDNLEKELKEGPVKEIAQGMTGKEPTEDVVALGRELNLELVAVERLIEIIGLRSPKKSAESRQKELLEMLKGSPNPDQIIKKADEKRTSPHSGSLLSYATSAANFLSSIVSSKSSRPEWQALVKDLNNIMSKIPSPRSSR